jgi:anaerobic ribonucleoside-triphosphate reductase activating protein
MKSLRPPVLLRLNKAHYPVSVLGYGKRVGVWFQGCAIRCKDCVSQDTWDAAGGSLVAVDDLVAWCKTKLATGLDGVTLSGGEPFDQPAALGALLDALLRWRQRAGIKLDVLCYSGYPLKVLQARHAALLAKLDALIPEPYAASLQPGKIWRGSANQPLVLRSPLGESRYAAMQEAEAAGKTMQVAVENGRVWMIGIPAQGDMRALESLCAERGMRLNQVSWQR